MTSRDFLRSRVFAIGSAAVFALVAAAVGWHLLAPGGGTPAGGVALVGGPFALTDQRGQPVTDRDFAGRYMLIYFGYTFCPDFCPMSLSTMTRALDLLPPDQAERVVPILITIDPERDTVEQLAEYAPLFHPRLVALTGSRDAIKEAARAYRVYFSRVGEGDDSDYLMDHSTFIYLMGPDGGYLRHFGHTVSAEEVAQALEAALAGG
jgi:cytochrome oxidase Cu insertion factor (SCO1/SenC/PrrC family)